MPDIKEPFFGDSLEELLDSPQESLECIAEGFLYKKCSIMHTAQTGSGKSTLIMQMALELSMGLPLFSYLEVKNPQRIYYLIRERPVMEAKERINKMKEVVGYDKTRLCLDPFTQGYKLYDRKLWDFFLLRFSKFKPDIIIIDPIYADNPGLSKEEIATEFNAFVGRLINDLGCFVYLGHHPTKTQYTNEGDEVDKADPFFGSSYLKNAVTGGYYVKTNNVGTHWKNTKDTHGTLLKKLELQFDPRTFISKILSESMPPTDRMRIFLRRMRHLDKTFNIEDIEHQVDLCKRTAYAQLALPEFSGLIQNLNPIGIKGCYKVCKDV